MWCSVCVRSGGTRDRLVSDRLTSAQADPCAVAGLTPGRRHVAVLEELQSIMPVLRPREEFPAINTPCLLSATRVRQPVLPVPGATPPERARPP